jgi:serine/threonine protein kinase
MVREDGPVVLTDFGIATTTGDPSITSTGLLLGSPAYIAPERARGEVPGPPSDLWSLGATLFTAVEGRPPYDGRERLITVTAVVTGEHAPFVAAGPLEPLLEGLLEKDRARRLDTARAKRLLEQAAVADAADVPRTVAAPVVGTGQKTAPPRSTSTRCARGSLPRSRRRRGIWHGPLPLPLPRLRRGTSRCSSGDGQPAHAPALGPHVGRDRARERLRRVVRVELVWVSKAPAIHWL